MKFLWKEILKRIELQNLPDIDENVINLRYYKLKILCYNQLLKNTKTCQCYNTTVIWWILLSITFAHVVSSLLTQIWKSVKYLLFTENDWSICLTSHKNMCAPSSQRKLKSITIINGTSLPALSVQFRTTNSFTEQLRQKRCFLIEQIY